MDPDRRCIARELRRRLRIGLATLALAASIAGALDVWAGSAIAATVHPFITQFGSFANPQGLAVDQANGDIYAIDVGAGTVSKFGSDLLPKDFSALGTNVLDGAGSGDCAANPLDCDQTPDGGFSFDQPGAAQVAIDRSRGATDGDIYVTDSLHGKVDVFASTGAYLGQLTGTANGPFGEGCGVAVDGAGAVYVGDFFVGVHRYVPSGNPPVDGDFTSDIVTPNPCGVAADSAGNVFVNQFAGPVTKFDALGQQQYVVTGRSVSGLAVDPQSDHAYVLADGQVSEYDASGALAASLVSSFGSPEVASPAGVAVDGAAGKIYVADGSTGGIAVFGTATLPDATTGAASAVQSTSATVSGSVDPLGTPTTWQFEYGTDTSYRSSAPATPGDAGTGNGGVSVNTPLTGLLPNTTYHFRLDAFNAHGTTHGDDNTFTTSGPPLIRNERLFSLSATAATVSGQLYSGLLDTTYRAEYGLTTSYGSTAPVPAASLGAGPGFQLVKVKLEALQPLTTYHWRLVATNALGTTHSVDHSFQTDAVPASDAIPRPPGTVDGRGYELVSQPQKNGNQVNVVVASSDGDHAVYQLLSGGAPGSTSGIATLVAERTPTGWISHNALPPRAAMLRANYFLEATTPDLAEWIAAAKDGLGGTSGSPGVGLARLTDAGDQTVLHTFSADFGPSGLSVVASDDLRHVFVAAPETIDPSHVPGTDNVYDFGGTPKLIDRLPGTNQAPACGLEPRSATMDFPGAGFNALSEHWTSVDGSRVFFSTPGDDCNGVRQLYVRDLGAATATLISGPPIAGAPDNGIDRFLQATPDGSQAFFRTATSLTAADHDDGDDSDMDIYRWVSAGHQLTCVTCSIPSANVPQASGRFSNAAISQDGSHAYFLSAAQGSDAPAPGDDQNPNLYVWRAAGQSVHFIAQINTADSGLANLAGSGGETTPDGTVLLFRATGTGLDQVSGTGNGGFQQYYRYDDHDGSLTCISCVPGQDPTSDTPETLAQPLPAVLARARAMTDDGRMVFFSTSDALVPQDVNAGPDIYEWHDGAVKLITNGHTSYPPFTGPAAVTVSPEGRDFFFLDHAHLTSEAEDGALKLYDARIGGGFPPSSPPAECTADQCQSPPTPPPALFDPSSATQANAPGAPRPGSFTIARISRAQRARLARTGRLTLSVRVHARATLSVIARATLRGRTVVVARASEVVPRARTVHLTLRLSHVARQALARQGHMRLTIRVRLSGSPQSKTLVLSLKAPSHGR